MVVEDVVQKYSQANGIAIYFRFKLSPFGAPESCPILNGLDCKF